MKFLPGSCLAELCRAIGSLSRAGPWMDVLLPRNCVADAILRHGPIR